MKQAFASVFAAVWVMGVFGLAGCGGSTAGPLDGTWVHDTCAASSNTKDTLAISGNAMQLTSVAYSDAPTCSTPTTIMRIVYSLVTSGSSVVSGAENADSTSTQGYLTIFDSTVLSGWNSSACPSEPLTLGVESGDLLPSGCLGITSGTDYGLMKIDTSGAAPALDWAKDDREGDDGSTSAKRAASFDDDAVYVKQ